METIGQYVNAHKKPRIVTFGSPLPVVRLVQLALVASGASLQQDGKFGRMTEAAVKRFQAAEGLHPTGYVGPKTAYVMDELLAGYKEPDPPSPAPLAETAPWVAKVRALTGTKEFPGAPNSPIILAWRTEIARAFPYMAEYCENYTNDAIPWCGYFMAYCMASEGIAPAWGQKDTDRFLYALSWSRWGRKLSKPKPGCIMVFERSGGGHVSMLEKLQGNTCYIRGGNQSDMVNVSTKSMDSFVAAVWPEGFQDVVVASDTSNAQSQGTEV